MQTVAQEYGFEEPPKVKRKRLTYKAVNKAIAHTNLYMEKGTWSGSYNNGMIHFMSHNENEPPVGVCVARINHLSLEQWVEQAEKIRKDYHDKNLAYDLVNS
tara:strand:+ start:749 stop:1054 length:306 start_codon:yes stop_codon:yes gene_type:complete